MNWNNHGPIWHIDHIIPCKAFDLTIPEQQRQCFHYTNLQPMFAMANLSKRARILTPEEITELNRKDIPLGAVISSASVTGILVSCVSASFSSATIAVRLVEPTR
jgi:hypothetical protein